MELQRQDLERMVMVAHRQGNEQKMTVSLKKHDVSRIVGHRLKNGTMDSCPRERA